jgi:predicted acyltransferase
MPDSSQRSLVLDLLRGLTLALMIVVNMSVDDVSYGPLLHASWHGLTLTDLVFPSFLFAVGASLEQVLQRSSVVGPDFLRRVLVRVALLFLIGFALSWMPFYKPDANGVFALVPLSHTRILGVLQRIALCYGAAAVIIAPRGERAAWWLGGMALLSYGVLLAVTGDLTLEGNGPRALDLALFGAAHLYHGEGLAFDPEGLMSTLPAIANVCGGYLAARQHRRSGASFETVAKLLMAAAILVVVALSWSAWQPLNKKLWTPSYSLLTIGIDCACYAMLVHAVELRHWRLGGGVVEALGRNTLALYVLSELGNIALIRTHVAGTTTFLWVHAHLFAPWAGQAFGALLYALVYLGLCGLVARELVRRGVYLRL